MCVSWRLAVSAGCGGIREGSESAKVTVPGTRTKV